jgi:hypothetical protein
MGQTPSVHFGLFYLHAGIARQHYVTIGFSDGGSAESNLVLYLAGLAQGGPTQR